MIGAFKPTASRSVGLLWKIPWRLSAPRKQRQRERLRRVDNVVAVLDRALKRRAVGTNSIPASALNDAAAAGSASPSDLATTEDAVSQQILRTEARKDLDARRHGRGPRQGEMMPEFNEAGVQIAGSRLLGDVARERGTIKKLEQWKATMPTEGEMVARDKYTMFDKKERGFRKGVHKLPKWTRVSQRVNPPGF